MKPILSLCLVLAAACQLSAVKLSAQVFSTPEVAFAGYFDELKNAEAQHSDLWDRDMYGPVLLVNPKTRETFSNFPDAGGALKRDGGVYHGTLPDNINIANTMTRWNGRDWAMVALPLPGNKEERITLLAHELFHVAQGSLGFRGYSPDNGQLDEKDGRIFLRLELEALRKALEANSVTDMKKRLTDALTFRECRYVTYPDARQSENLLELNEGLAEYTGFMVSDMPKDEALYHFETSLNAFVKFPTFVRSFAYETIPIYGYLLQKSDQYWNKRVTPATNLAQFFIREFALTLPQNLQAVEHSVEDQYDGRIIRAEETSRESLRNQEVEKYRDEFVKQPHLEIQFERMNISFDPRDVIPLDDKGTVYPTIRVTDNWGILEVQKGALLSPRWDRITVSIPTENDGSTVAGDGWTLRLNAGYAVVLDSDGRDFLLRRK